MKRGLFELRVPLFRPMWRRIAMVLVLFGWGLFEYSNQQVVWSMVFFAVGALAVYQYFFAWKEPIEDDEDGEGGKNGKDGEDAD